MYGEKIVIVFWTRAAKLGITLLGYEPEEKARLLEGHQSRHMVLVTGPSGSGKTVRSTRV
jgi:type II secretory ATPase GspE/PulE/Tfp pilus assembly ATPase PilB-like protein